MKSVITTALLCAAAVSANASWSTNLWEDRNTYQYDVVNQKTLVPTRDTGLKFWETQGTSIEVNAHFDNSITIDFKKDARYELTYQIQVWGNPTDNGYPYCNLSLVTSSDDATILFGNSKTTACQLGIVVGKDVNSQPGMQSLCADSCGGQVYSTSQKGQISEGPYTYKLIFETFSDANIDDKIYFGVTKNGVSHTLDIVRAKHLGLGGYDSKVFNDIGFHLNGADFVNEAGSATVDGLGGVRLLQNGSSITEYSRTVIPTPDVPEPSAFGLLAGLGAIALAVSRRRRSR
ncbi:MAG: PEP-CTERM sorting domain-containing protein [Opitutales bacterium]|nr:PEP-CTERM sorting domain-containing protein [Opitutales bacterium]